MTDAEFDYLNRRIDDCIRRGNMSAEAGLLMLSETQRQCDKHRKRGCNFFIRIIECGGMFRVSFVETVPATGS